MSKGSSSIARRDERDGGKGEGEGEGREIIPIPAVRKRNLDTRRVGGDPSAMEWMADPPLDKGGNLPEKEVSCLPAAVYSVHSKKRGAEEEGMRDWHVKREANGRHHLSHIFSSSSSSFPLSPSLRRSGPRYCQAREIY